MQWFDSVIAPGDDVRLVDRVAGIDPRVTWSDPMIGEWWIDPGLCYYDRPLPFPPDPGGWTPLNRQGARPTSGAGGLGIGKWTYVPEGEGVRTFYFSGNGPDSGPVPMMQYFATWDGTPWADPHSVLLPGQLAQVWRIDPRLIVRLVLDNTSPTLERWEWAVWAASTDARIMACSSWDSSAPDRHNLQVFGKYLGPTYDSRGTGSPVASVSGPVRTHAVVATEPMVGRWLLDPTKSSFLLSGQDAAESRTEIAPFMEMQISAGGDCLRHSEHDGSAAAEASSSWHLDGDWRSSPTSGDQLDTVATWRIGAELIVRGVTRIGGRRSWSLFALSKNFDELSVTSWHEKTPEDRDIRLFKRVHVQ
jgi:hypothetical protein